MNGPPRLERTLYSLIARKRHELIEIARSADDARVKADAEARIRFLIRMREELEASIHPHPVQSVFISYSVNMGSVYLNKIKPIAEEFGFTVLTGFDRPEGDNVLRTVRNMIEDASVYLGLLTPEYSIKPIGRSAAGSALTAPSVWIMEEKGMAIALNKPVRLLIESTVHQDFWKRTTPDKLHNVFTPHDFEEHARIAILSLYRRYEEMLLASLLDAIEPDRAVV